MTQAWENYYKKLYKEGVPEALKGPRKNVKDLVPLFKEKHVKTVLDLGCGFGRHLIFLAKEGFEIYGQEISETALKMCDEILEKENIDARLVHSSMEVIPFSDNFFDAVICITTLAHEKKDKITKTIAEVYRVLKSEGIFFFNVPSTEDSRYGKGEELEPNTFLVDEYGYGRGMKEVHHFFTEEELQKLLYMFSKVKIEKHTMKKGKIVGFYVWAEK